MQLFNVKEVSTRQAMLLAGEVHMTQLSPDLERAAVANGMVTIESKIPVRMPYLMFGGQYYPDKFVGKRTGEFPDLPFYLSSQVVSNSVHVFTSIVTVSQPLLLT